MLFHVIGEGLLSLPGGPGLAHGAAPGRGLAGDPGRRENRTVRQ